jgi:ZIP family zinc transporter
VLEAGLWGLVGASSLIVGALLAFAFTWPATLRGWLLAFGAGTLIGAVAYELIEDAVAASATGIEVGVGFAVGALVFFVGSLVIDRLSSGGGSLTGAGTAAKQPDSRSGSRRGARTAGLAVVLGAVLDGIPESIVLGMSLTSGSVGIPMLVAIFVSNVPESLSASEDLARGGVRRGRILALWMIVAAVSGLAAALGFGIVETAPPWLATGIQAFAGGAILAMLAESMIPEANEIGGRPVGLATCLGFAVATWLSLSV